MDDHSSGMRIAAHLVATDPDGPGDRAALGIARALRRQCDVTRLELPEGRDACDLHTDELAHRLARAFARSSAA